jgi:hypothetical protein
LLAPQADPTMARVNDANVARVRYTIVARESARCAVTAKVDDRGLQLHQMTRHLVHADGPPRAELEVLAIWRHAELALDCGILLIERKLTGAAGIGSQKQDNASLPAPPLCVLATGTDPGQ